MEKKCGQSCEDKREKKDQRKKHDRPEEKL